MLELMVFNKSTSNRASLKINKQKGNHMSSRGITQKPLSCVKTLWKVWLCSQEHGKQLHTRNIRNSILNKSL